MHFLHHRFPDSIVTFEIVTFEQVILEKQKREAENQFSKLKESSSTEQKKILNECKEKVQSQEQLLDSEKRNFTQLKRQLEQEFLDKQTNLENEFYEEKLKTEKLKQGKKSYS